MPAEARSSACLNSVNSRFGKTLTDIPVDYHKRVEEIHQAVDRLRFHANATARALSMTAI
jgi:hypothetical protein